MTEVTSANEVINILVAFITVNAAVLFLIINAFRLLFCEDYKRREKMLFDGAVVSACFVIAAVYADTPFAFACGMVSLFAYTFRIAFYSKR